MRRNHPCNFYTPFTGFDPSLYAVGNAITFKTSRGTTKAAKVLHVDRNNRYPRMIIEEANTGRVRFVIERQEISDAYSELFPDNKAECVGWFNRGITID